MILNFLINCNWVIIIRLSVIILFILSFFLMMKYGYFDYKKKLGVTLGQQYKHTMENDKLSKELCQKSDVWGFIVVLCVMFMVISYIIDVIKSIISWL